MRQTREYESSLSPTPPSTPGDGSTFSSRMHKSDRSFPYVPPIRRESPRDQTLSREGRVHSRDSSSRIHLNSVEGCRTSIPRPPSQKASVPSELRQPTEVIGMGSAVQRSEGAVNDIPQPTLQPSQTHQSPTALHLDVPDASSLGNQDELLKSGVAAPGNRCNRRQTHTLSCTEHLAEGRQQQSTVVSFHEAPSQTEGAAPTTSQQNQSAKVNTEVPKRKDLRPHAPPFNDSAPNTANGRFQNAAPIEPTIKQHVVTSAPVPPLAPPPPVPESSPAAKKEKETLFGLRTEIELLKKRGHAEVSALQDQIEKKKEDLQRLYAELVSDAFIQQQRHVEAQIDSVNGSIRDKGTEVERLSEVLHQAVHELMNRAAEVTLREAGDGVVSPEQEEERRKKYEVFQRLVADAMQVLHDAKETSASAHAIQAHFQQNLREKFVSKAKEMGKHVLHSSNVLDNEHQSQEAVSEWRTRSPSRSTAEKEDSRLSGERLSPPVGQGKERREKPSSTHNSSVSALRKEVRVSHKRKQSDPTEILISASEKSEKSAVAPVKRSAVHAASTALATQPSRPIDLPLPAKAAKQLQLHQKSSRLSSERETDVLKKAPLGKEVLHSSSLAPPEVGDDATPSEPPDEAELSDEDDAEVPMQSAPLPHESFSGVYTTQMRETDCSRMAMLRETLLRQAKTALLQVQHDFEKRCAREAEQRERLSRRSVEEVISDTINSRVPSPIENSTEADVRRVEHMVAEARAIAEQLSMVESKVRDTAKFREDLLGRERAPLLRALRDFTQQHYDNAEKIAKGQLQRRNLLKQYWEWRKAVHLGDTTAAKNFREEFQKGPKFRNIAVQNSIQQDSLTNQLLWLKHLMRREFHFKKNVAVLERLVNDLNTVTLEMEDCLRCKVCDKLFDDPVVFAHCGHTYCSRCHDLLLIEINLYRCAICGQVGSDAYVPNVSIAEIEAKWWFKDSGYADISLAIEQVKSNLARFESNKLNWKIAALEERIADEKKKQN